MKKIKKIIIALILMSAGLCASFGHINSGNVSAENFNNPSEYYNVKKQYWAEGSSEYSDYTNSPTFSEGDAILLSDEERIVVTLGEDTENIKYSQKIYKIVYTIKINDNTTFENTQTSALSNYGIEIPYVNDAQAGKAFELTISPKTAKEKNGELIYGKYTLEISYVYVDENLETQNVYFASNFYVLNY